MPSCFDDLCPVDPSPAARKLLWHALSVGRVWRDEPETHAARDKAGMFLFWVEEGKGELRVAETTWKLTNATNLWLLDLGTPRAYLPGPGERLVTFGVRFGGPALHEWKDALIGKGQISFKNGAGIKAVRKDLRQIRELAVRRPAGYEWLVHECLTRALGLLLAERQILTAPVDVEIPLPVSRVLDAVLQDPSRAWRAAELAKIAGVSYSGLRAMFRSAQQESLSGFLQRTRLHQARFLMASEGLSMKEIAARLDFSSEYYFSQWFRRQTGSSPTKFRQSLRD
ncbi:helix-turn-helix transcriptional regulator [Planctomicrobium sp. SH664]|uniref:helix-turn-helix transcriptional regulator n=1 Tax=Planctomicrobium sp. SH664 TaxID=3448125 RepID=UPI003F5BC43E